MDVSVRRHLFVGAGAEGDYLDAPGGGIDFAACYLGGTFLCFRGECAS